MKLKNYEKNSLIIAIGVFTLILEIIFFTVLINKKIYSYNKMSGIIMKNNIVIVVLDKEELFNLHKNVYVYHNNKRIKFKIEKNNGAIISKGNNKYYEVLIKLKLPKNYKSNDLVELTIKNKKIISIKIFKLIWDGDLK